MEPARIFYFSVPKLEKDMTADELRQEIALADEDARYCAMLSQGISVKETVRRRRCIEALILLGHEELS